MLPTYRQEKDVGLARQRGSANLADGSLHPGPRLAPDCISGREQVALPIMPLIAATKPALEDPGCLVPIDNTKIGSTSWPDDHGIT
ncbi:MAG: hypothetical protein AB7U38_04535 [Hyphomicrobiales bacterium]